MDQYSDSSTQAFVLDACQCANLEAAFIGSLCVTSFSAALSNDHDKIIYLFWADARNFSSIQASPHQKEDIWSSCCGCLVYSCPVYSYRFFTIFPGTLRYYSFVSTCGHHTSRCCVALLFWLFLTRPSLLNFIVERILSIMVQSEEKEVTCCWSADTLF